MVVPRTTYNSCPSMIVRAWNKAGLIAPSAVSQPGRHKLKFMVGRRTTASEYIWWSGDVLGWASDNKNFERWILHFACSTTHLFHNQFLFYVYFTFLWSYFFLYFFFILSLVMFCASVKLLTFARPYVCVGLCTYNHFFTNFYSIYLFNIFYLLQYIYQFIYDFTFISRSIGIMDCIPLLASHTICCAGGSTIIRYFPIGLHVT